MSHACHSQTLRGTWGTPMVGQHMGQSINAEWDMESHCPADLGGLHLNREKALFPSFPRIPELSRMQKVLA